MPGINKQGDSSSYKLSLPTNTSLHSVLSAEKSLIFFYSQQLVKNEVSGGSLLDGIRNLNDKVRMNLVMVPTWAEEKLRCMVQIHNQVVWQFWHCACHIGPIIRSIHKVNLIARNVGRKCADIAQCLHADWSAPSSSDICRCSEYTQFWFIFNSARHLQSAQKSGKSVKSRESQFVCRDLFDCYAGSGQICVNGVCVAGIHRRQKTEGDSCLGNYDCHEEEICLDRVCQIRVYPSCSGPTDCNYGQFCSEDEGICRYTKDFEICDYDDHFDCAENQFCYHGVCEDLPLPMPRIWWNMEPHYYCLSFNKCLLRGSRGTKKPMKVNH